MTSPSAASPIDLPAGITALGPDTCAEVQRLVAAAERTQDAEVLTALDQGLKAVPRPLRGIAKRILVG